MNLIKTLEEAYDDMKNGVYDFTKDGKCIGCGACCSRFLPLSEKEISDIRSYVKNHKIKQQFHNCFALARPAQVDMTCPFLDDSKPNNKCTIYEVRPLICKDFICQKGKVPNKALYYENRILVDMEEEFF